MKSGIEVQRRISRKNKKKGGQGGGQKLAADLPESLIGGEGECFALALQLVPIHTGSVHVLTVAYQHFQMTVRQNTRLNTDKGVAQFVE